VDSSASAQVGKAFESMLLAPMLRPMLPDSNVLGAYGLDLLARDIAAHDRYGFARAIAAALESRK
jgi:hypothetical protein